MRRVDEILLPEIDEPIEVVPVAELGMVACRLGSCVDAACKTWDACLGTDDDNRN